MTTAPPLTRRLAEFVHDSDASYADDGVREDIELLVADYLGVALRGSATDGARIVAEELATERPDRPCTLIGSRRRAEPPAAAMANAVAAHSVELDDVDRLALFHFSPPIVSAALAVAETTRASGPELLRAVTIGCEVMTRLSAAMNPALRDRGFHTTPVCGIFGATAAASRLLGASTDQTASAFGIAGAQAGGLMQMYGPSMQKRLNPGPAARDGVGSALLALRGFEGTDDIIEGDRGVIRAFSGREPDDTCLDGLGQQSWVEIEYKAYACARPIHNAIDAGLAVREALAADGHDVDAIDGIRLARHPDWASYHQIPAPRTYHEAQVSVNYGVALALGRGAAFFDDYLETVGKDATVADLAGRVTVQADDSLERGVSCLLTVTTSDGATYTETVDYPTGSPERPMGRDGLRTKFMSLAACGRDEQAAARTWELASAPAAWTTVAEVLPSLT